MNSFRPTSRSRSAFTLTEIIVVVAIVGLLAALLLPTLKSAQVKAKMAASSHNLSQLSLAMDLFCSENNNRYPGPGTGFSSRWLCLVAPYLGFTPNGTVNGVSVYTKAYQEPIFYSPMVSATVIRKSTGNVGYGLYGLNGELNGTSPFASSLYNSLLGFSRMAITNPSNTVLLGEIACRKDKNGKGSSSTTLNTLAPYPTAADGGAANYRSDGLPENGPDGPALYLFVDGHVESVTKWPSGRFKMNQ